MTFKTQLGGAISILAITLIAMPAMAASKAKNKNIECKVTVDGGEVSIKKTINGKTIKTDENDEDCAVVINDSFSWNAGDRMMMKQLDGADGKIEITIMDMDDGAAHGFFRKGGAGKHRLFFKKNWLQDGLHKWSGEMDIEEIPFGPGMMPMGNILQFTFMPNDHDEMDLDKDGSISPLEARKARNAKLKSFDSNRDGTLSLDEFQAYWVSRLHAQMVDAFQDLDEDGDARVTAEEFAAPVVKRAEMNARVLKMLENHHDEKEDRKNRKKKRK